MPDRYGEPDDEPNDPGPVRETAYGPLNQHDYETRRADAILRESARRACDLCDPDGYRPNGIVCDHIDRTETNRRGIAACRAALKPSATNTPPTP